MRYFKKNKVFLSINDENIYLFFWENGSFVLKEYKVQQIISLPQILIKDISEKELNFVIVPDYWIANRFYPITSKKDSVIEAFLSRRLSVDFPELIDLKEFFEYVHHKKNEQEGILVYFIQEELFYKIYNAISSHIYIHKITSAAFLWQAKIKEINKGQKLFIHVYQGNAYLCFFSDGIFLFSRTIFLSHPDYINQLSYEIMQSFRLFSQTVKKEVEKIYLISENEKDQSLLQNSLHIEVERISEKLKLSSPSSEIIKKLGSIAFLNRSDLSESARFFYIIARQEKKVRKWNFFQDVGILTGLLVFILMLIEAIFMNSLLPLQKTKKEVSFSLEQYISAVNELLDYKKRPDPSFFVLKIINSLLENITLNKIDIELESGILELQGNITVKKIEDIEKILSSFLQNLKKNLPEAQIPLIEDIYINKIGDERFEFRFKMEMV